MRVKCKVCGKLVPREEAYKVVVNKVNKYYCSEMEYNDQLFYESVKQEIAKRLSNILDMPLHSNKIIFKEWNEWRDIAPDTVILDFLRKQESYLISRISKIQASFNKIRYLSAIVKNSIEEDEI